MEPDEEKTIKATEALQTAKPGFACPFCQHEDTLLRQVRSDDCEHSFALYNTEQKYIKSTYPVTLLTCYQCGFCMPFLGEVLDLYLQGSIQEDDKVKAEGGGDDGKS